MSNFHCRICASPDFEVAWELAPSPYGDLFRTSARQAQMLPLVGLTLVICRVCHLLQIIQEVDAEEIYSDYLYQSSVTSGLASYYLRLSSQLVAQFRLHENDLVIDVGSNDGTGLKPFRDRNLRVLGIEPSRGPASAAVAAGIPTLNTFLNEDTIASTIADHGSAKLVCANYVAANVPDPVAFFRGMRAMLQPEGAISVLTGYHPDQFAVNMFDYINHDHLSYLSVGSALKLAENAGLKLTGANRVEHKGGSIHLVFHQTGASVEPDESISKILQRERWLRIGDLSTYRALANRIDSASVAVREILSNADASEVAGIGASISTTHLLHQFRVGGSIARLYDDDKRKIGLFSPGLAIEVSSLGDLRGSSSPLALLLAWQHSDLLLARMRETGFRGRTLVPLPDPLLIDFN